MTVSFPDIRAQRQVMPRQDARPPRRRDDDPLPAPAAPAIEGLAPAFGLVDARIDGWIAATPRAAPIGGWSKRAVDVVIASVAILVSAPIMVVIAVLIRLADGGPVFFAHTRVGFGGRLFPCYKFRTMVTDSERMLAEHLARDPEAAREWRENQKLRRDPRVNFLGRLLRKSSLDELPQFFNVLVGDMSCVGPRPVIADELERYGPHVAHYLSARPGLTGLWQVTGRGDADYDMRVKLDATYVSDWSFWRDLMIVCRTPFAVVRFREVC